MLHLNVAMQIVHSRTFGNAAPDGSVGVHMVIPLVDLLNHSGDETSVHDLGKFITTSNVRSEQLPSPVLCSSEL